jgi:hypothetical protein
MKRATSKAQLEKRGRRPIDAEIRRFINQQDFENKSQRPEDRLPQSVLAHSIHEKLLVKYKGRKRIRIPKVSTIQKMLSKLPKEVDEIDGHWNVRSLYKFPIPAVALPTVLRAWAAMREAMGRNLTIREAQWVARLHIATERVSFDYLVQTAMEYAEDERITPFPNPSMRVDIDSLDLSLFEAATGEIVDSPERAAKILGHREFDPGDIERMMFGPNWHPMPELGEIVGVREYLRDIGGKNERATKQRQSTKAQRHRQRSTGGQG